MLLDELVNLVYLEFVEMHQRLLKSGVLPKPPGIPRTWTWGPSKFRSVYRNSHTVCFFKYMFHNMTPSAVSGLSAD